MTGWIVLGVIFLLLVALCLLPVGIHLKYETQFFLRLTIGPFSVTLLPKEELEKKEDKKKQPAEKAAPDKKKNKFKKPNHEQLLYSIEKLPPILLKALKRIGRGVLIKPLIVKVVFAGEDPADVAQNYGKAQALVSALYPKFKKVVRIRKTMISLSTDYQGEQMVISAELGIRLRIGTILFIAFSAGFALLRWFLGYRRLASPVVKEDKNKETNNQAKVA